VNVNGYVEIKIADRECKDAKDRQRNWKAKHVVVWEKANGPVPKGHIVIFLDGDKTHIVLKNLMMVSRKAHAVMCHMDWYTNDREATKANCLMAEIKVSAANLKRKSFNAVKNRKIIFLDNNGYKVYVIRDKNRWIPVRETRAGNLVRLRVKELRSRASRSEAQRDLHEYAAYRGWMRI
jgi:chaperone required for assembly of F1-ATPase